MYRNIFAVLLGILFSTVGLVFSIKWLKKCCVEIKQIHLIMYIQQLCFYYKFDIILLLILLYTLNIILGCSITAYMVLNAKTAYSILTGSIIIIIHLFLLCTVSYWLKIMIIPIIFQLSYFSGEFIKFLQKTN
ncbi:hypothetical protein [Blattabacterium cuenoti]|uniref:hypothetical protein n=1 Tax=Blattabacterium cuenoti TaxID=1653831 RepID=UPI00163CDDC0|nr:hypothetical protein [Blattabacterium cuenoti]